MALLEYWQEGEWRSQFNTLPIPSDKIKNLISCSKESLPSGQLSLACESGQIWVAPIVYQNKNKEYWIPLWIPAFYEKGHLNLTATPLFPWFVENTFDNEAFVEWCLDTCLTEDKKYSFESWAAFYEATLLLLKEGNKEGYELKDECVITPPFTQIAVNDLLARYMQMEESFPMAFDEVEFKENAHLFCATSSTSSLTKNEYELVMQALLLNHGEFLGIKATRGSNKEAVIDAIAASKSVHAMLNEKALPVIYRLAPTSHEVLIKNEKHIDADKDKIHQQYKDMITGLNLAERVLCATENEFAMDEKIAQLQNEDESIEQKLDAFIDKQRDLQKVNSLKDRWQKWFNKKEDPISESIRQCKVKRTKIHQQLVEAVEEKMSFRQAYQYWKEWYESHDMGFPTFDLEADIRTSHQKIAHQIYLNAKSALYEVNPSEKEVYPGWSLYQWCQQGWANVERIGVQSDMLIIDCAHRLYPQQVFTLLSKAQMALFFGDPLEYPQTECVDGLTDEQLLLANGLEDDDYLDDLQYKGMRLSNGNAHTISVANASRESMILYEVECKNLNLLDFINGFRNYKCVSLKEISEENPLDGLHFLETEGHNHQQVDGIVNPMEARAIQQWLEKNASMLEGKTIAVMTPHDAQASLIQKNMPSVSTYTLSNLPDKMWDYVIFSTVFTTKDQRPYVFDQKETFFYSVVSHARRGVWIVGERALYNPKTHSPSGKLAKYLFKDEKAMSLT